MKTILIILVILAAGYYVLSHHSPFQLIETDPHYAEMRVRIPNTNIQLAGFGKMLSKEDCQARSGILWANVFKSTGKLNLVKTTCSKNLDPRYNKLFANEPFHATYLVFEKGNNSERDGRFVIFGVPSSLVARECDKIVSSARKNYSGKVYCIQGTVG